MDGKRCTKQMESQNKQEQVPSYKTKETQPKLNWNDKEGEFILVKGMIQQ